MAVLISLSIVTFGFGMFIFFRGEHSMHQVQALIFFLLSALFLSTALLFQDVRGLFARWRGNRAAPVTVAVEDSTRTR
jgi:hypothetical protein